MQIRKSNDSDNTSNSNLRKRTINSQLSNNNNPLPGIHETPHACIFNRRGKRQSRREIALALSLRLKVHSKVFENLRKPARKLPVSPVSSTEDELFDRETGAARPFAAAFVSSRRVGRK